MEHYLGVARAAGITKEEIGAVQGLCMAVSAGKVNAMFKAVEKQSAEEQ